MIQTNGKDMSPSGRSQQLMVHLPPQIDLLLAAAHVKHDNFKAAFKVNGQDALHALGVCASYKLLNVWILVSIQAFKVPLRDLYLEASALCLSQE